MSPRIAGIVAILFVAGIVYAVASDVLGDLQKANQRIAELETKNTSLVADAEKLRTDLELAKESARIEADALRVASATLDRELKKRDQRILTMRQEMKNAPKEIQDCYDLPAPPDLVRRVYGDQATNRD